MRMVLVHLSFLEPQSLQLYENGNVRRPNEIDETLISLGHSVDSAFQTALAAASDPLGNLGKDPSLNNVGVRATIQAPNPWLPVRVAKGERPPFQLFNKGNVVEYQRPWAFPNRNKSKNPKIQGNYLETPLTTAGPYPSHTMPHQILGTSGHASNHYRKAYEDAPTPVVTENLNEELVHTHHPLGDPVIFSTYLLGQTANNRNFHANFNLDADRGYGFLCWDWERNDFENAGEKDGRGRTFKIPKTWPEGSEGDNGPLPKWTRPENAAVSDKNRYMPEVSIVYPRKVPQTIVNR